ncbi:hypothetical protein Tco_0609171 [Tanacetum coccineum]
MIHPEPEGSTQGYPLVSVKVLRYDTKGEKVRIRIMLTEMELTLEQTQQGVSYENIQVISFTMKMEILLELTSNKLMVDSILQARNLVKEILLKLSLPDHRSILTDLKMEVKIVNWTRHSRVVMSCDLSQSRVFLYPVVNVLACLDCIWSKARHRDLKLAILPLVTVDLWLKEECMLSVLRDLSSPFMATPVI